MTFFRLKELHADYPENFYSAWPDVTSVHDRWRPMVRPLYNELVQRLAFNTPAKGGQWVPLSEAVLQRFEPELLEQLAVGNGNEVLKTVVSVYSLTDQNLVELPEHVFRNLDHLGMLDNVEVINARHVVHHLLPHCLDRLEDVDKLNLLHYLCCHGDDDSLLRDQPLLPLQGGTFGVFRDRKERSPLIYFCREELLLLFPGLESRFCRVGLCPVLRQHLNRLAMSGMSEIEGKEGRGSMFD